MCRVTTVSCSSYKPQNSSRKHCEWSHSSTAKAYGNIVYQNVASLIYNRNSFRALNNWVKQDFINQAEDVQTMLKRKKMKALKNARY